MKPNSKISAAVAAIVSASGSALVLAAPADQPAGPAATPTGSDQLAEVIVTANRREQNLQDVPITIQALTAESLSQLNATTFDDYAKFLPNVTSQGLGPGQSNVYMRGLSTAVGALQGSGAVGAFTNVAIYLDEQSGQIPGRNLDIYAADLERIEVLEGPQGTLFGAGAEAGVVRYITNKPKLGVTEANFNAGYATTAHGDPSSNIDATINLPVGEQAAVRAVIYNDSRGGYINNIPGTFARAASDRGSPYFYTANHQPPANSLVINNNNLVSHAINPVTYQGIRVEGLYKFNDEWNALVTQSYQNMRADGVFAEMATDSLGNAQPDLSVQLYNPSWDKDRFEATSWTLNGRFGDLKAIYTGGYLVRNVEQVQDYTNYSRGRYANYYQCVSNNAIFTANPSAGVPQCFSPSSIWRDVERNTHISHEIRLSTPDDWRARGLIGLFYEKYEVDEQVDWFYESATQFFEPIGPPTGYYTLNGSPLLPSGHPVKFTTPGAVFVPGPATANNPNIRQPGDAFFDDLQRGYTQKAAFGSGDLDIVPHRLTVTFGTRYYQIDSNEVGSAVGSFGCKIFSATSLPPNPCLNHSNFGNLDALNFNKSYSGFRSRANLTWKVTDDAMLYYTWSQGFRAGGFNRPNSVETTSPLAGVFTPPTFFGPDTLTNNEVGWKTEWLDHRVQFNGAVYQEQWKGSQISLFDPGVTGNLTFTANGGDYKVKGLEMSVVARVTHGLTLSAGASWNHSELTRGAVLLDDNGNPIDFSKYSIGGVPLVNPAGPIGSPLAGSPPFQGNLRARYEFPLGDYEAFCQLAGIHQAHSFASTDQLTKDLQGNSIAYDQPGFSTYDASVGLSKDAWVVTLYGQNVTDVRADLYTNYRQWYKAETVNRPRTLGLNISYRFTSK
jgi:iron complex outermembrane receptor protein